MKLPWHIYIHIHAWILLYLSKEKIYQSFYCQCYHFPASVNVFLPMLPLELFHYLLFVIYSQVDIIIFYIMSVYTSQSLSKFYSLLNNEKSCAEKETDLILFHLFGMIIAFRGLTRINSNFYGVIKHPRE